MIIRKILIIFSAFVFISALFQTLDTKAQNQSQESWIQKNIIKIKERLGDKFLKTADDVIAKHVEAVYSHLRLTYPHGEVEDRYFDVNTGFLHGI